MILRNDITFGETIVYNRNINFIKNKINEFGEENVNIAEVGVYKGGSAKIILDTMNKNSKLYLFDTFEGIPNKSDCDNFFNLGDLCDTSYESVLNLFINNDNVHIFKGNFPKDTGKYILNIKFNLVHLDVDMYLSYKQSLEFFYDKMIVGGYIIFDDYNSRVCEGATIAINEFFLNKKENVLKTNDDVYFFIKE
jgi:hypothetical protein